MGIDASAPGGKDKNNHDPRRRIPRTDALLALPEVAAAARGLDPVAVAAAIGHAQERARKLEIGPEDVAAAAVAGLRTLASGSSIRVLNATGVVVHTNLGRAPLSPAALDAAERAAGYVDVELDLETGRRSRNRGAGATHALLRACPDAEDALVVNNGAGALLLATAALAGGGEVAISRGELIEIGAGFRLPELIESAHVRLVEVGATNRTHPEDYRQAARRLEARALLKVHPSNYRVEGFHSEVDVAELRRIADAQGLSLIVDIGSGLLQPHPLLPEEPDASSALRAGADVVLASGDKLLGGPQAGILLGTSAAIARLKRHPLFRALRVDKLRLAALEATLTHGAVPVRDYLERDPERLRKRSGAIAARVRELLGEGAAVRGAGAHRPRAAGDHEADAAAPAIPVVRHEGRIGGGGAPGVPLPGWALRLPEGIATALRHGTPAVLARVHEGACLVDPRCVPEDKDEELAQAIAGAVRAEAGEA